MRTKSPLEWQFVQEEDPNAVSNAVPNAIPGPAAPASVDSSERQWSRLSHLYELLLGIALLYGVAVYLIWQQAAHRMVELENELATLRSELSTHQVAVAAEIEAPISASDDDSRPRELEQIETAYFHFEMSLRARASVQAVAQHIDATYQQFNYDFGVPLQPPIDKLPIIVDPALNLRYDRAAEDTLIVPFPQGAAKQYGLPMTDALTNVLLGKLALHVLNQALRHRKIQPQWQVMIVALKTHLQLVYGYNQAWQSDSTLLANRHQAQHHPLSLVLVGQSTTVDLTDPGLHISPTAFATAEPLIEFILATYGYAKVPALLNAFATHESWETLIPSVFGISAGEFQENWHAYLKQTYP